MSATKKSTCLGSKHRREEIDYECMDYKLGCYITTFKLFYRADHRGRRVHKHRRSVCAHNSCFTCAVAFSASAVALAALPFSHSLFALAVPLACAAWLRAVPFAPSQPADAS